MGQDGTPVRTVANGDVFTISLRKASDSSTTSYSYTATARTAPTRCWLGCGPRQRRRSPPLHAQEDTSRTSCGRQHTQADFTLHTTRGAVSAPSPAGRRPTFERDTGGRRVWTVTLKTAGGTESYSYTSASCNDIDKRRSGLAAAITTRRRRPIHRELHWPKNTLTVVRTAIPPASAC